MKITYNFGARQIGKTTQAIEIYKTNPKKIGIVCVNHKSALHVSKMIYAQGIVPNKTKIAPNVFSATSPIKGRTFNKLILDEYDYMKDTKLVLIALIPNVRKELIIFTTPKYKRNHLKYILVREFRKDFKIDRITFESFLNTTTSALKEEYLDLYDDIITNPKTELVKIKYPKWKSKIDEVDWYGERKKILGEDAYDREIFGELFK